MPRVIQIEDFFVEVSGEPVDVIAADATKSTSQGPVIRSHTKMGGATGVVEAAAERVANTTARVHGTIASVCGFIRDAMVEANKPDELKVKFALEIGGEAGIPYLTRGSGKAVLEIEATWKNQPDKEAEPS